MFKNIKKMSPRFSRFPFSWLLIGLWAACHHFEWGTEMDSGMGVVLLISSFAVMALEFFKAVDIGLNTFRIELASALLCTMFMTSSITLIVMKSGVSGLHLGDYIVAAVALIDAWMNPSNTFAMALRNFAGGNVSSSGDDSAD